MSYLLDWDHIYKATFSFFSPVFDIKCSSPGTYHGDYALKLPGGYLMFLLTFFSWIHQEMVSINSP